MKTPYYSLFPRNGAWILQRAVNVQGKTEWLMSAHFSKESAERFLNEMLTSETQPN